MSLQVGCQATIDRRLRALLENPRGFTVGSEGLMTCGWAHGTSTRSTISRRKIRGFTNIRKGGYSPNPIHFSFRPVIAVLPGGCARWHANCLESFGPYK